MKLIRRETGRIQGVWFDRLARRGIWRTRASRWMWVQDRNSLFIAAARWRLHLSGGEK